MGPITHRHGTDSRPGARNKKTLNIPQERDVSAKASNRGISTKHWLNQVLELTN